MDRLNLLKNISEVNGIPGFESEVRELIKGYVGSKCEIETDNLGSLVCRKAGQSDGPKIMIPAHMDEIGFMVHVITDDGFIKFIPLGGWWDQVLLGQRVQIRTSEGLVSGVIGSKPPHILKDEDKNKVVKKDTMFIDVGASSKQQVIEELHIRPGDPIFPVSQFEVMGNGRVVAGKAWDDRAGCAALIELLDRLENQTHPNTLYAVATVQEEVGLRGARTSTHVVQPDIGIALDVGIAGDVPGVTPEESPLKLGAGPVMYVADGSAIAHFGLRRFVIEVAEELNIPLQFAALLGGGTDAGEMHLFGAGVPSLTLGVPVRYIHTHTDYMHLDDYDNLVKLLEGIVQRLDWDAVREIKKW
ncbi:MAG: M42 family metallopeptidase [Firmicutes bacterium]|nr:M42 family metallopeptidase [Bacillota bacterium]